MPTSFQEQVYALCKQIPKGKVSTYKGLAHALHINSSQAIGQALKCNPYAPKVPCHRVIKSNGTIGGFMGQTAGPEIQQKIKLLKQEGIKIENGKISLQVYLHTF